MKRNRGTAAVLAMIFLVVFAVLGVSFYTMATASSATATNDRVGQNGIAAAESGFAYIQRLVGDVVISESKGTGTLAMNEILAKLQTLNGSATMRSPAGETLTIARSGSGTGNQILIPQETNADGSQKEISLGNSQAMSAIITCSSLNTQYAPMTLQVTGHDLKSDTKRTLTMTLKPWDRTLEVFYYGVFAKGRVDLVDRQANIIGVPDPTVGSLGSAYTGASAICLNGGTISGDISVVGDPATSFSTDSTSGSIGGVHITNDDTLADALKHVRQVDPPTLPEFKPNQFYRSDLRVITSDDNITGVVADACFQPPAGQTEVTIKFTGNAVLQGLIYVKPGVTLQFNGSATINGVIVVEDPNLNMDGTAKTNPDGTPITPVTSSSTLNFKGTTIFTAPQWPSNTVVPQPQREELAQYSMLAPTAYVYMTGNSGGNTNGNSNSGFAKTVVCGTMNQNGSGLVDLSDGMLLTMADTAVSGPSASFYSGYFNGDGVIVHHSKDYKPPMGGYTHLFSWVVDQRTYQEKGAQ